MDNIEADRASKHWMGDFEKIDDGRSAVLIESAGQQTEILISHCMLDTPVDAHVSLGWFVE